jgi:hypothetical protein
LTVDYRSSIRVDHFELDGPFACMNNNRLFGLTDLPVKAFPR